MPRVNDIRELQRAVVIACAPDSADAAGRLLRALGASRLETARAQAERVLHERRTQRIREVLRTLEAIEDALDRAQHRPSPHPPAP